MPSAGRKSASSRAVAVVAVASAFVAAAALLASVRSYALVGWDTFPEIASSRFAGPGSIVRAFREETAAGYFPYGAMYRPLFNLSLGLDHALWGLEPFGYLLTGVLLYAALALATFWYARRVLGGAAALGPLVALATMLLLPAHIEIVPVVSRRADLLCAVALVLGAAAQAARAAAPMPRGALVPALWTALALASKEPGLVLLPVAFVTVLALGAGGGVARLRRAVAALAVHAGAAGCVLAGRLAAIGGMGGHPMATPAGAITRLADMTARETWGLLTLPGAPPSGFLGWVLVAALAAGGAAATIAAGRDASRSSSGRPAAFAIAAVWLLASASVFGVAGLFQPWYLAVPAPAFALLAGAAAEAALAGARAAGPARRMGALAALGGLAAFLVWFGSASPLLRRYNHWGRASALTRTYLDDLAARIAAAPPGAVVRAAPPPAVIAPDPDQRVVHQVTVLRAYSVQAWADLVFGNGQVLVREARGPIAPAALRGRRAVVLLGRAPAGDPASSNRRMIGATRRE